ncbi:bifunctional dethiobiotin synthetase/adenosylmethionine-8-amino-7-oxononanoate aminotransferase [Xylariaceae sp. FL0594]|nr:bifunctional dethiobiotin synthetase/adenosylmethionine-8-amino-7-oxononanoate aminotransferase [Xylariaceae sp. FL0594]
MPPIGSLLWRNLRIYKIYGANTDVGKTIFTTIFCNASKRLWKDEATAYLKPVSTGPDDEADDNHIKRFTKGVVHHTAYQYGQPVSPHIAARGNVIPNEQVLQSIYAFASERASAGPGWLFIETAGGVHSPGPSGTTQADLYAPLRCPVVLVGDHKLGGISSTISAFESLRIRGYDVESVVVFDDPVYGNSDYLKEYFEKQHGIPVTALPVPPPKDTRSKSEDEKSLLKYYLQSSETQAMRDTLVRLDKRHKARIKALEEMPADAHRKIWYPFTQQKLLQPEDIVPIDSAHGSHFQTFNASLSPSRSATSADSRSLLRPSFDGSASWWTQGLGHGSPSLTLAAAYAAGRYGHVMFAGMVHEPALKLADTLLANVRNPRLSRVFFSDNGSTGMEVAVKMALRASRVRYGWSTTTKIDILGLRGSYHGDTIGTMDCAEPNTYNEKVEWYEGRGVWLDYPQVLCVGGEWRVQGPGVLGTLSQESRFADLADVFDVKSRRERGEHLGYEAYIASVVRQHLDQGRKFGALILEPVVLGAGGMALVDPLFQHTLVYFVRQNASLFGESALPSHDNNTTTWRGLPVVFDEVFTGIYRLGRFTAASLLNGGCGLDDDTETCLPDISVHAKLLTGGLVPLCVTLASEDVFDAFASDDKADALLHGHSYTAHPVGCQVALESLAQLRRMDEGGAWEWAKKSGWSSDSLSKATSTSTAKVTPPSEPRSKSKPEVWSIWPLDLVHWISGREDKVAGVWALGSVLAVHLRAVDGSGYTSTAAEGLRRRLLDGVIGGVGENWNVHSRVLGNVLYLMGGQKTTEEEVREISALLRVGLGE